MLPFFLAKRDGRLLVEVIKYLWKVYRDCPAFQAQMMSEDPYMEEFLYILFQVTYSIEDAKWVDLQAVDGKFTLDFVTNCFFSNDTGISKDLYCQ